MQNINKILLTFCLFSAFFSSFAQDEIRGKVIDSESKKPIAFVNIIYNSEKQGTTTDMDGYFSISRDDNPEFLKFSFVGYKDLTIDVPEKQKFLKIKLKKKAFELEEVKVYPGVNPAHRIINNAIENRDEHSPTSLDSYKYKSYSKFYISLETENLKKGIKTDSSGNITDTSSRAKMVKLFEKQHLFFMESVTEKIFAHPDKEEEKILASKVSGLQNPRFTYLAEEFQSFSFYNQTLKISGNEYISPLCNNSTKKYLFIIKDTAFHNSSDSSFIIKYQPRKNTNFSGLKGIITINSNGWAIQNVIAEPFDDNEENKIIIKQKYNKPDGKHWFPAQLTTKLIFNFATADGNSLSVSNEDNSDTRAPLIGVGKTYIRDVEINEDINKKIKGGKKILYTDSIAKRDSLWWINNRNQNLDEKENETYEVIDSLGEAHNFDRLINNFEIIAAGSIPWKIFNFNLDEIFWYNEFEGTRLGLGVNTNERLSEWFSIHGYGAFGFRNDKFKYGGDISIFPLKNKQLILNAGWSHDVKASNQIFFEKKLFSTEQFREFFIREMDWYDTWTASIKSNPFRGFYAKAYLDFNEISVSNNYRFRHPESFNDLKEWQAGLEIKWIIKEDILRTPKGNVISMGSKYPEIQFNIRKGFDYKSSHAEYLRLESRISDVIETKWIGDFHITLNGAYLQSNGDAYLQNFYLPGTGFWLDVDNSFATMGIHEFVADRYTAAFLKYDIGSLLFSIGNWKPEFALITNACIGSYSQNYQGFAIPSDKLEALSKVPDKGYIESGLQINSILKQSFTKSGVGFYYNYGPYSTNKFKDNYAVKLRVEYTF